MTNYINQQDVEEFFKQLLGQTEPQTVQYIEHLLAEIAPAEDPLREVDQRILDEPIPQEEKKA